MRKRGLWRTPTSGQLASARDDHARGPFEPSGLQVEREEAGALAGAGHDEVPGLVGKEAEALVIGGIADQQDGTMAALCSLRDGRAHQGAANALAFMDAIDRQGAEQQG